MKDENENERFAMRHRKIARQCIQIGVLQLVMMWQQLRQYPGHLHRKETNMEKMEKFTHPIELSDQELDLVAAGCGSGCSSGGNTNNGGIGGLIGIGFLNDNNVAVQVGAGNVAVQKT
jgi:hypothetical protein